MPPLPLKRIQSELGGFDCWSGVDRPHIITERLTVLVGHELGGIPNLMYDAQLYVCLGV